jgi:hypothetical protein
MNEIVTTEGDMIARFATACRFHQFGQYLQGPHNFSVNQPYYVGFGKLLTH